MSKIIDPYSLPEAHRLIHSLRQEVDSLKERIAILERLPQLSDSLEFGKLFRSEMREVLRKQQAEPLTSENQFDYAHYNP